MTHKYILALAALLCILTLSTPTTAGAASNPAATATPYPTYTPYPSPTHQPSASPTPSPTPSPSPTPAATIGGAVSSDSTCGATGIAIPLPLGNGLCLDIWGVIQRGWASFWGGVASVLETQIHNLTDAVLGPLVRTDNPTANGQLVLVKNTLSTDASDAFAVVFGIAVLWTMKPAWFGNAAEGIALLWRSGLVLAGLASYDALVNVWIGVVNALSGDIGTSTMHDLGHTGLTLFLAPFLILIVGLERAVLLHLFAFIYEVGPLAIIMFAWPPTADIARTWLRLFAYLSLLGPAYALMLSVIVSLQSQGAAGGLAGVLLWNNIMVIGGLLVLTAVPAFLASLLTAASHAGAGSIGKVIATAAKIAAL